MNMVRQNLWQYCGGDLFTIDQTEYIFVDQDRNGISLETVREPFTVHARPWADADPRYTPKCELSRGDDQLHFALHLL